MAGATHLTACADSTATPSVATHFGTESIAAPDRRRYTLACEESTSQNQLGEPMRDSLAALAAATALSVSSTGPAQAQGLSPIRTVKGGILDEVKLYVEKLPASTHVAIRQFSATDADIVKGDKKEETSSTRERSLLPTG